MARTYKRDSNGRFASGGGGVARPKARSAPRGQNRLTRDNAGRITSVGGEGATARGGRLRTAGGNRRATQTARVRGKRAGVIRKVKSDVILGLKLRKNADDKYAWFSSDRKQVTGAYATKAAARKSPEIEARIYLAKTRKTSVARMSAQDFQGAERKWKGLTNKQILAMAARDASAAKSLQNMREFTGNGTRRSGAAMANQAAREAFASARQAARYVSERSRRRR